MAAVATMTLSAATVTFSSGGTDCGNAGLCTSVAGAHQINFDLATAPSLYLSGAARFTFAPGDLAPFVTGSVPEEYMAPLNNETRYLSVGSPGRTGWVIIDFAKPIDYYGLYLGSPDAYNLIEFFETGSDATPIATFTGDNFATPGRMIRSIGEYVNFAVNGGTVSRIVLSSGGAAFESDNHAYSEAESGAPSESPEPATLGLMSVALLGLGAWARRRDQLCKPKHG
jgi:hypothetical protein